MDLIDSITMSPAATLAAFSMVLSTLNQWLHLPSGSSEVRKRKPLIVPSTIVWPRDGSFALALSGSLRMVQAPILNSLALKLIVGIFLYFSPIF
jgi:hypothetical protein